MKKKMNNLAGIDLGTTFSAIAVLNSIGKGQIVPNAEGERITPSAVYFDEDSKVVRVGIEAINSRQINPDRCARWIKRNMGDPDYRKSIDGKDWCPEELSSLILKKLKQDAEIEHGKIEDVVISVPAHFDEVRRKATMDAGVMAGLNVIAIVNEPVAAALYYAMTHDVSGRVLVYDLGGGTFDATILQVDGQEINIICSQGDHALGGIDFDKEILQILESQWKEKYGSELISNDQERAKYEDEAEDIKRTLSRRSKAKKMLYGNGGSMPVEISQAMFEEAISPLIGRTEMLIEILLKEADCTEKDIDKVLLVGGSTRIPLVQRKLEEKFGHAPETTVNVDECVALGAAIYAGLTKMRNAPNDISAGVSAGLKDVKLQDVCNHSYGTICAPKDAETGQYLIENSIILKKNTPIPCKETTRFYTMVEGQRELQLIITQGEDRDPDYVNKVAAGVFELPSVAGDGTKRAANRPISVTYSYDQNQRMHCEFKDEDTGKVVNVELNIADDGRLDNAEVEVKAEKMQTVKVK